MRNRPYDKDWINAVQGPMKHSRMFSGNIPGTLDPMNPFSLCNEPPNIPDEPATDGAPKDN